MFLFFFPYVWPSLSLPVVLLRLLSSFMLPRWLSPSVTNLSLSLSAFNYLSSSLLSLLSIFLPFTRHLTHFSQLSFFFFFLFSAFLSVLLPFSTTKHAHTPIRSVPTPLPFEVFPQIYPRMREWMYSDVFLSPLHLFIPVGRLVKWLTEWCSPRLTTWVILLHFIPSPIPSPAPLPSASFVQQPPYVT